MEKPEEKMPLVSIVVITYNSSRSVLETLDSAKAQDYQGPLELIVADDCSPDETVALCRTWIAKNKDRFVHTEIITVEANTGIASNINRGFRAARGKWVKAIAGDDVLMKNCISDNLTYIAAHPEIQILFSDYDCIDEGGMVKPVVDRPASFFGLDSALCQYYCKLYKQEGTCTPTMFISKALYDKVGGFDERYQFIEDLPFQNKVLKCGYMLYYMPVKTILYRRDETSITSVSRKNKFAVNVRFHDSRKRYLKENCYVDFHGKFRRIMYAIKLYRGWTSFWIKFGGNRRSSLYFYMDERLLRLLRKTQKAVLKSVDFNDKDYFLKLEK